MRRRIPAFALFVLLSTSVFAQDVFVLPGLSATGATNGAVFTPDPFAQAAALTTAVNATYAFAGPAGKFYIVSNTSTNTVQVANGGFAALQTVANFIGASYAAITPDGTRLMVISSGGTLNIVNTTTDTVLASSVPLPGSVVDIAPSIDSTRAFALIGGANGNQLAVVNLVSGAIVTVVALPGGAAIGVSVGPNGLVYVSEQGAVLQLDPNNFAVDFTMAVNGRPGRLYFTPDGGQGIAGNLTPATGAAAFVFNLSSRTLSNSIPAGSLPSNVILDTIVPVGNNRVIAYSSSAQTLFDITLNPLNIAPFAFSSSGAVGAAVASNSYPTAAAPNTQFLFFTSGNTLYRVDLNANQVSGQQTLTSAPGTLSFAAAGLSNGTPAAIVTSGDNQSIAPNTASAPLVVKVIDAQGHPLAGVQVIFTTSAAGATFSNVSLLTDNLGDASTTVTGTVPGPVPVAVTAGPLTTSFTVNIGGGASGPGSSGGLSIVAGQGQIISELSSLSASSSLLTVKLTDSAGNPVANAPIVFSIQSGTGSLAGGSSFGGGGTTVSTDQNGLAATDFTASSVAPSPPSFSQTVISASTPSGNSVTFYVSAVPAVFGFPPALDLTSPDFGVTLTAQTGQTLKGALTAAVSSGTGTAMPNIALFISNPSNSAPAMCAGTFALTDATGHASCDLVATGPPGTYQITPSIGNYGGIKPPITLVITPGAPSAMVIVGGNQQSGAPGQRLPQALLVQVNDAGGHPLAGVPVSWTVTPAAAATLSNISGATNSQGQASANLTFGNTTGPVQVQVSAAGVPSQTFNFTITVPVSSIQLLSGGGQTAQVNTAFGSPIVVQVVNASGAAVAGVPVTFSVSTGSATLGSATATTDSNGRASTTVTAGANPGPLAITAQANGFSVTASLTAVPVGPSNIAFSNGASFQKGSISPGEIVAITGSNLVSVQGVSTPETIVGPLPTTFQGVTVTFNGTAAPIYAVSNVNGTQQIVVQVPYEIAGAVSANVVITGSGGSTSGSIAVPVQPYAPGIFETTIYGARQAVAIHANGSYVSPSNPAQPGENITVFATGLGQTTPALATNATGISGQTVSAQIVAGISNAGVQLISAQSAPGLIGVYAVTLQVPTNAAAGNDPVQIIAYDTSGNPYFAQGSFLAVQ